MANLKAEIKGIPAIYRANAIDLIVFGAVFFQRTQGKVETLRETIQSDTFTLSPFTQQVKTTSFCLVEKNVFWSVTLVGPTLKKLVPVSPLWGDTSKSLLVENGAVCAVVIIPSPSPAVVFDSMSIPPDLDMKPSPCTRIAISLMIDSSIMC